MGYNPGMTFDAAEAGRLLRGKDFAALEAMLARVPAPELARALGDFSPIERLVLFKLLDAPRAMEVFGLVGFDDRYLLFCGFPLQAIAPVLEGLSVLQRRAFVQLPREDGDRMFRLLWSESASRA